MMTTMTVHDYDDNNKSNDNNNNSNTQTGQLTLTVSEATPSELHHNFPSSQEVFKRSE